jgi:hypothetical protein
MMDESVIREAAQRQILFLPHAILQMSRPDRMIQTAEVRETVFTGEIIEKYPEDPRGPSALLWGKPGEDRVIHVVCTPREEYLAIITAYIPDPELWLTDFRERKR